MRSMSTPNSSFVSLNAAAIGDASVASIFPPGKLLSPGCFLMDSARFWNKICHFPSRSTNGTTTAERKAVSSPINNGGCCCNCFLILSKNKAIPTFLSYNTFYRTMTSVPLKEKTPFSLLVSEDQEQFIIVIDNGNTQKKAYEIEIGRAHV